MKRIILALLGTSAALPAFAADIVDYPPPEPPVVYAPAFSWTGLYVGGQAGGSFNSGSSNAPTSFVFVPGIAATPGTPEVPATPGTPFIPGNPGSPGTPGTPFIPGTPGTPGTPAIVDSYSFACGVAGTPLTGSTACSAEINGRPTIVSYEQLAAAYALTGNTGSLAAAGQFQVVVAPAVPGTPGTPDTPATPGTPAVAATPDTPATPGTPFVPATPGTPGVPEQNYAYTFGPTTQNYSDEDDSFAGGAHIGYNYALGALGGNTFVVGAVADLSYVDITRGGGLTDGFDTIGIRQELDYLATVRLKAGAGLDRFFVYGTGGVAFGKIETSFVATPFLAAGSDDDTRVGYAVGAGTDYAVTDNLAIGLEYLYTNLGSDDRAFVTPLGNGSTLTTRTDEDFDFHTVWGKVSYRFN